MREFCFDNEFGKNREKEKESARERTSSHTFVRLSRHFPVNEPHVAGEPSWSTRAARSPPREASRDLTPHCSRGNDHDRSADPRFYPYRTPILHDTPRAYLTASLDSFPFPLSLCPLVSPRLYNPFHLQDSLPTRLLNSSRSPPPCLFISFTLLDLVPFARLLPHRHLQPPPCFPADSLSLSLSLFRSFSPSLPSLLLRESRNVVTRTMGTMVGFTYLTGERSRVSGCVPERGRRSYPKEGRERERRSEFKRRDR